MAAKVALAGCEVVPQTLGRLASGELGNPRVQLALAMDHALGIAVEGWTDDTTADRAAPHATEHEDAVRKSER